MSDTLTREPLLGQRAAPAPGQASDIGLYGSAPAAFVLPAALLPQSAGASTPSDMPGGVVTSAAAPQAGPAVFDAPAAIFSPLQSEPVAQLAPIVLIRPAEVVAERPAPIEPVVPAASGAGSTAPSPPVSIAEQAVANPASSTEAVSPLVAQVQAQAAQLEQSIAALTQQLQETGAAAVVPIAAVEQVAADLGVVAGALVETATDGVAATANAVLDQVGEATEVLSGTVGAVIEEASETAADLVGAVAGSVEALASGATETAGAVVSGVGVIAGNLTGTVASVAASVAETVTDLPGADPAGGVATLVGLVSAADVFALNDDGPTQPILPLASDALGMADLLSVAEPIEPLLGIIDHDDGALGGLIDDDPLGLGF